jgi:uncharacterized RDD family membrane protein YckC
MKTLEIKTTQNVSINYELATLRERILAFVIDSVFKSVGVGIITLAILFIFDGGNERALMLFYVLVIYPTLTFYTLFFETVLNGQTPGKRIMRIKVMKLNGKQPVFYDYLLRWAFRIVDLYLPMGILGSMSIVSSRHAQRTGDVLANTVLVRVENKSFIALSDILRIDSKMSYQPQYTEVKAFHEEDILIIKAALDRTSKYNNNGHRDAIIDLSTLMAQKLNLKSVPPDSTVFLKTILKDYIVLTR